MKISVLRLDKRYPDNLYDALNFTWLSKMTGTKSVLLSSPVLLSLAHAAWKINFRLPIIPVESAPCRTKAITPI